MTVEPFVHRDINRLGFNACVLQEAVDKEYNPLYERIKFFAIYSSNLDKYFRVRVSQLRQIKRVEKSLRKKLSLQPTKTIKQILVEVNLQQEIFGTIFNEGIIPELKENGIFLLNQEDFNDVQKKFAENFYETHLKPNINVKLIDLNSEEIPFWENNGIYYCVLFEDSERMGFIQISTEDTARFVHLGNTDDKDYITFIDDIIRYKKDSFFDGKKIIGIYEIKLSRDAELYLDDELDGILAERIYNSLKQRQDVQPTRLLYDTAMPKTAVKKLRKLLSLGKIDMMPGGRYHNFNDFFGFPDPSKNPDLHYKEKTPIPHKILENAKDYFEVIAQKDQLLHFPYMSFGYVERFMEQAAADPKVQEIKISFYRVAEELKLTSALLRALENGKKVTLFIEAKARFDEENNINWGRKFEEHGASVIYSYPRLKIHSKIFMITRTESDGIKRYAYIGTGNFNAETSKIYVEGVSDDIYMTSIVDRYLEHGRIYLFHNGGEEKMYMGSADWMTRNLDRRIEVLTPIYDPDVFRELKDTLDLQLSDNQKARIQNEEEDNRYVGNREERPKIRSQYAIYDYLKEHHAK